MSASRRHCTLPREPINRRTLDHTIAHLRPALPRRRLRPSSKNPNHQRKLSEVLLEFASELTGGAGILDREQIDFAIMVWNLGTVPEGKLQLDRLREEFARQGDVGLQPCFDALWQARKTRCGNDRRFVIEHQFTPGQGGENLRVSFADLDNPEHRAKFKA